MFDKIPLPAKFKFDEFGFLHIDNVTIARTGIQYYLESEIFGGNSTDMIAVARFKEDVLNKESIKKKNILL